MNKYKKYYSDFLVRFLASATEKQYIAELKSAIKAENHIPSEDEWAQFINQLCEHIINDDPRNFLRWEVIRKTMFCSNQRWIEIELNFLKRLPEWETRWKNAIKEVAIGYLPTCSLEPTSSDNLIHHAYHIASLEEKTKVKINNIDFIFEFGGGYGSMCRLCYNLNFRGQYIIFDFPQFSALQKFYLQSLNLPVQSNTQVAKIGTQIICLSDFKQLEKNIINHQPKSCKMFIATWSISEAPMKVRELLLPLLNDFDYFLIGFQNRFGNVNNINYFTNWKNTFNNVTWHEWDIVHLQGNKYLIGIKNTK